MLNIKIEPIGYVRCAEMKTIQDHLDKRDKVLFTGRAEFDKKFATALEGLEMFDRMWLIFVFNQNIDKGYHLKVHPRPDPDHLRGMFVTRTPYRPNPIGLSCVKIITVKSNIVEFENSDILDGTPILDIKPYIPRSDAWPESAAGWIDDLD